MNRGLHFSLPRISQHCNDNTGARPEYCTSIIIAVIDLRILSSNGDVVGRSNTVFASPPHRGPVDSRKL